jgi:dihydroorotate dehydrogenase
MTLPAYRIGETYDWNYEHVPPPPRDERVVACPGTWDFCGIPTASPLGVPAGPLLNSRWILYYAALGFDVLTYKTVRSVARASYERPNLLPIEREPITGRMRETAAAGMDGWDSWAISFGMPSKDPRVWQDDVEAARKSLPAGKILVVSVVASPQTGWSLERIAADFARCAAHARDAGAHAIEANLSCPNVSTQEGSLFQSADASGAVAAEIRNRVRDLPLVLKVGAFDNREQAAAVVGAVAPHAAAISTTNTIAAIVTDRSGAPLFGGHKRGIGGRAIGERCLAELTMLRQIAVEVGSGLRLIGVGGIGSAADAIERLAAGAHHVQIATAAMINPAVGIDIRDALARRAGVAVG